MWTDMLVPQAPLIETILRAALAYIAVIVLIRLIGKRGLAEMSTFDIVVVVLLADIVAGAATADDNSVTSVVVAALTLVA